MVAISASDTLLDVGTGTGAVLREVERLPLQPARAIGVEVSKPMPARARATLSPGTELLAADARALPLADASVTATSSSTTKARRDQRRRRDAGPPAAPRRPLPVRRLPHDPSTRGRASRFDAHESLAPVPGQTRHDRVDAR